MESRLNNLKIFLTKLQISENVKMLEAFHLYISCFALLIWLLFVMNGYVIIGHVPRYGDSELILFNNKQVHEVFFIVAMCGTFSGIIFWPVLFCIKYLVKLDILNRKALVGLIVFGLTIGFINSSQFAWILD